MYYYILPAVLLLNVFETGYTLNFMCHSLTCDHNYMLYTILLLCPFYIYVELLAFEWKVISFLFFQTQVLLKLGKTTEAVELWKSKLTADEPESTAAAKNKFLFMHIVSLQFVVAAKN